MSGFPVTGVPGVPGGYATLSSTGSVLSAIPSGSTGVGVGSLSGPDTSGTATAMGLNALQHNTSGGSNSAFGAYALAKATTAGALTAVGAGALANLTTGGTNSTAVGYNALNAQTTGVSTAVGAYAGAANTTATITAIGDSALTHNVGGGQNTALGTYALYSNVAGGSNTGIGDSALYTSTGNNNTAVGANCLSGTSAAQGTAIGTNCLGSATTGGGNTAIGYGAGNTPNGVAANATVLGANCTLLGQQSGAGSAADPSWITCLGALTTCVAAGGVAIGADHTGAGAAATLQDQIMLGTANHTVYEYQTNTSLGATYSNPTLTNSVVGAQINATKDTMLYLEVTTVFVLLVISMGSASTPTNAIFTAAACPVGTLITLRVPGGWYVATSYTSGAFHQAAVTC